MIDVNLGALGDRLIRGVHLGRGRPRLPQLDKRYAWKVVEDPSGDFLGRCFQLTDLEAGAAQGTWPEGILFRNRSDGAQKTIRKGKLVDR